MAPDLTPTIAEVAPHNSFTCKLFLAYNNHMDAVFKAVADPTRRLLLDQLYQNNGQTLNELCAGLGMSRQAVTQHLALLEDALLVTVVWHGREKLHYLNPAPIQDIYERWISKYDRQRVEALSDLERQLEANSEEPEHE